MISLKSEKDLQMMREAGKILAKIMQELQKGITAGISTGEINRMAGDLIRREGVKSAFKGYRGFPGEICVSVNEEVVHGIPGERRLVEGDIISLDLGIEYKGYFSDTAITLPIGEVNPRTKKLIEVTKRSLLKGIRQARINNHLSDISYAIQNYTESQGFSVVRQFVGHGIGINLHEEPEIPNFGPPNQGPRLLSGMVLAIEPMINTGGWECETMDDGWTVVTKDRLPSAHFEHTVAITPYGPEILTS